MQPSKEAIKAGQAIYSQRTLRIYDWLVLGLSNRLLWRCPTQRQQQHYQRWLTGNHLDVGVGTGYYLDHARFPVTHPRLVLMDLNESVLRYASQRLRRYQPHTIQHDVFEPIGHELGAFDSVALNYLLHCLPGSMAQKGKVLANMQAVMNPGARLYGATILGTGVPLNAGARRLMALYNRKGIFTNSNDHPDALERELTARFSDVEMNIVGCVALFSGRAL